MTYIIAISKKTKNVYSGDPNDFIFNSEYNTFKIIKTGIKTLILTASTDDQSFYHPHALPFIPLVSGFCKVSGESKAYPPNTRGVVAAGSKVLITNGVKFNWIEANATNIIFNFDNSIASEKTVLLKYYCLETI